MLLLHGTILNVFITKRGHDKSGEEYGGDDKVQIMVDVPADGGTLRKDLVDLKTENAAPFQKEIGKKVNVPVGVFAPAKGTVIFYITGEPSFGGSSKQA